MIMSLSARGFYHFLVIMSFCAISLLFVQQSVKMAKERFVCIKKGNYVIIIMTVLCANLRLRSELSDSTMPYSCIPLTR